MDFLVVAADKCFGVDEGDGGFETNCTTSALCTPSTWRKLACFEVTICGASLRKELLVDMVEALEETPETPDFELPAYGIFGGTRNDGASETGLEGSSLISSSGPSRVGRIGVPGCF